MSHENTRQSYRDSRRSGRPYSYRRKIYDVLQQRTEPLTDRQVIEILQESDVNNVRPEITRLKQDKLIEECGKGKCPTTGKTVRLIRLTREEYFDRRTMPIKDDAGHAIKRGLQKPVQLSLI